MVAEAVRVLGVPVDIVDERFVLEFVAGRIEARTTAHIATVNAEYVMRAERDLPFRSLLETAELRTPDGMGVVLAARRRGAAIRRRVGGSDLIWSLSRQAAELGHAIFLLGGGPGVASRAAVKLRDAYPRLTVAGTYSGWPTRDRDAEQVSLIRSAAPDILFVAFGMPEQDIWIARLKERLQVPIVIGVGGSFDYLAGAVRRAPRWMQNAGLEWAWRLVVQPWRWRRMMVLPRFAILAAVRSD
jgi:N-acetylglucosaminyldiphosphoundecaprenol N-acetyl-beta-D-mannosaminyltransferase